MLIKRTGFTVVEAIVSTLLVALFVLSVTTFFALQNKNAGEWIIRASANDLLKEAEQVLKFYPMTFDSRTFFLTRHPEQIAGKEKQFFYFLVPDNGLDAYREGQFLDASGNPISVELLGSGSHWYKRIITLEQVQPVVFPFYYKANIDVFHPDCNGGKSPCATDTIFIPSSVRYE